MTFYVSKKTIEEGHEKFKMFNQPPKPSLRNLSSCTLLQLAIKAALKKPSL